MQIIESFQNRLKHAMQINNIKQVELVEKTGIDKTLLNKYLAGISNARQDKLTLLADALGVNEIWLMGYDVPMSRNFDKNITGLDKKNTNSAVVLVYGTIPAGVPMEMIEDIIDTEEIPADMLRGGKQYFGLKVKGHSMESKYLDGDIIICERVDDCESGKDAVIMVNGYDGTLKRVFKDEENKTIKLQPLNTALDEEGKPLYEAKTYTQEEIEKLPVKIIGKVVELRRKI